MEYKNQHFVTEAYLKSWCDPSTPNNGSLTGIIGEELGVGLLIDYYHRHGVDAKVLNKIVTQGTNIGKRLDRWIVVNRGKYSIYYQVEIKNWGVVTER